MNDLFKNIIIVVMIFLCVSAVFSLFSVQQSQPKTIAISQLANDINEGKIKQITIADGKLNIVYNDDSRAIAQKEAETALTQTLTNLNVDKEKLSAVQIQNAPNDSVWTWLGPLLLYNILPLIVFIVLFFMIFRQARGNAMQAFDFTRARTRVLAPGDSKKKVTFDDVAGLKEAKEELLEITDFLKNPEKYVKMGAKIPRGVLLMGLPGTGKTLLAKAISNEAGVPFFSISGSEFIELFVGVGASRVRSLFEQAHKAKRAIIFIDEIDSIGKVRGVGVTSGHEEREQTLNQILAEMDGIESEEGIIVLGATNRPESLDPALLRPGRFDRRIVLDLPDVNDREAILKIHCRQKPLSDDVDLREVAQRTPGFSGADLANVVNEAALLAAKRNKNRIFQTEFLESIEKVILGPEKKSHLLNKEEKRIAAYHESGHALVSANMPKAEPVRKISIISRGMAAGYTLKTPTEEKRITTKDEFIAEIATLLGGLCAEKLIFGQPSTGASNDLRQASNIARKMVKEYGMSDLGPVVFGERPESAFLGYEFGDTRNYSESMAAKIDQEVLKLIDEAQKKAEDILTKKRDILEKLAQTLIEKETIEKEEFEKIVGSASQNSASDANKKSAL